MCCSSCCCCCCFCQAAAIFSQHTLLACLECWRLQEAAAAALCAMLVLLVVQRAAAHVSTSAYVCLTGSSGGSGAPLQAGSCVAVTAGCFDCCCCRCCSIGHLAVAPASRRLPPPLVPRCRHPAPACALALQLHPRRMSDQLARSQPRCRPRRGCQASLSPCHAPAAASARSAACGPAGSPTHAAPLLTFTSSLT